MHPKMYEAAKSGHFLSLTTIILENGEELFHQTTLKGNNILHVAAQYRQINFIRDLLQHPSRLSLLQQAHRKCSDVIEPILCASSSPSSHKGPNGLTALHAAVHFELPGWREILDKRPEMIREQDDIGWTPLHFVACFGKGETIRLLLQYDNSVAYVVDKEGQSALHIAAFRGHVNVIDELLRSCPDPCDILNTKWQTALHAAVIGGQANVVKYILNMPILEDLINEQDIDGNTALHLATLHKQYNIIYLLARDKRVDHLATNKAHLTAIQIFQVHEEIGYKAAKVEHVLQQSNAISGRQGWVIEHVKKRLDHQFVEDLPAMSIPTRSNTTNRENDNSSKEKIIDLQVLVAMLIATVTFAATFTMPGGYNNDGPNSGMPTLAGRAAFKAFVISNTTAFSLSVLAIFLQFDISILGARQQMRYAYTAKGCIVVAIIAMGLAFALGTYVVLTRTVRIGIVPSVMLGCLVIIYLIGVYLEPSARHWQPSRRYVRSLLFDYGIL
ncbi:ankyrin repeat-containing protein At5g02620 isoform X2 [Eucalyptus grandis]|uniref:ankyrin repeat-containing protein At5g02620 isoform X2 n=1 Tax=Eucalyptus grandis TaxID=71139 RepID=UPI00192EE8CE|nr:ankyrin repeat-containing protein At5g02620 isoform X2 [Eucalyptus grandis]